MRIFITGGTGFIGRHLLAALAARGHQLYALTRRKAGTGDFPDRDKVTFIEGDIAEAASYRRIFTEPVDLVYHLAAISGQKWGADEGEYHRINVEGTENLLQTCRGKARRFIFCSSINAVGRNDFRNDPYGRSKWQGEQAVAAASQAGLATVILRPAVVYGPGAVNGLIPNLCRLISRGKFLLIGPGNNIMPLVFVDDLVTAFLQAADNPVVGEAYEITGPDAPTLRQVVQQIAHELGVKPPRVSVPVPVARLVAAVSEFVFKMMGREPLITRQRVDSLISHRVPEDRLKAERGLGYTPKISLTQGLSATIGWYRQNGFL